MRIGIDVGGSHIGLGLVNKDGKLVLKDEKDYDKRQEDMSNIVLETIIELINKNIDNNNVKKEEIESIGIAFPGTVSETAVIKAENLGIDNFEVVEKIKKHFDVPIHLENDAKCAAIAENRIGTLKDYDRSIFLTLGTGIGGAVIINNKLLDTGDLSGCEFGHMIIQKDGIKCNCGKNGCFEKYASMKALKTNLREALGLDEKTRGQELLDIIRKNPNNEIINKVIDEYIEYLSIGISNLINIFEPEAVCIGGSFVYFADVLLEKLKNNIQKKKYLFNNRDELIIMPAALGNDAGIIGCPFEDVSI